jgi:ABC-type amino acid transport substrate-binding protein
MGLMRGALGVFCLLSLAISSTAGHPAGAQAQQIKTLSPGVLRVAVTIAAPTNPYDPQLWIHRYVERFADEAGLTAEWVSVPFDQSWELAGRDEVDLVATNVAGFPDRVSDGGTFSSPFLYERRALRIRPKDRTTFARIDDFGGRRVGVVRGTAAERDVQRRAPRGVEVVASDSFASLYQLFESGAVDAVAEAEYFSLDGRVIPSHGPEVVLIDLHDLTPGQQEESVFVVRNKSDGLLAAVNRFVTRVRFPL